MRKAFIAGFDNKYEIYEDGTIVDTRTGTEVPLLYSSKFPGRYPAVSLETGEYMHHTIKPKPKHASHKVHRLMAETFLPNPYGKPTVNHIDGNTQNNNLSNLEWATYSENAQHACTHAGPGRKKKPSCVTEETKSIVLCALVEYNEAEVSVADISEATELPYSAVRYSLARLIDEGRVRKNSLCSNYSKYTRYSYTVLDKAIEAYQTNMPGFLT